jgi:hypothetical protein
MTAGLRSQCDACVHVRSRYDFPPDIRPDGPVCAAFPDGIPKRVYANGLDHRQPIDGDEGFRFLVVPGDAFPEWAFAPEVLGRGGSPA